MVTSCPQGWTFDPEIVWEDGVKVYLSHAFGVSHFKRICAALSEAPRSSSLRVNSLVVNPDEVLSELNSLFSTNRKNERAETSSREISCEKHPHLEEVIVLRGSGPHSVDYSVKDDRQTLKEIVVSRKCAESVLRGAQVFVPGVYACSPHLEEGDDVAVSVAIEIPDGEGGWTSGFTRGSVLGTSHTERQRELPDRSKWFIGRGRSAMSRTAIFRETSGVAVEMVDRVFRLPPCNDLLRGKIFLQNIPSIVAAHVLDPQPGERILDMCAAPGGKTTAIAALMKDEGEVIALDRSHNKVNDIKSLAAELGLKCIKAFKMNSLKAVLDENVNEIAEIEASDIQLEKPASDPMKNDNFVHEASASIEDRHGIGSAYRSKKEERKAKRRLLNGLQTNPETVQNCSVKGFPKKSFDRVLLDAPCSALGLRPRLFAADISLEDLRKHSVYQRRLLDQAVQLVKPNGILVYSTCTLNPGENEAVVRYALDKYKFLRLTDQEPRLGGSGLVGGLNVFDGVGFKEWLREDEAWMVQRFDPSASTDTIGFFIAKFVVE